ncbi:hypothetical protein [Parasitella parasitica]|uniref:Tc1-like transposase DDE domain-containing protein n=1 Tax=Parasitella parasitica TaxID=35722 RepID=A0A0B7NEA4_9FUNG|nr:hypothetical protein [Parasitella parasitica]
MNDFIHEDGQGGFFDEQGKEVSIIQMEIDDEAYPLQNVTNFDDYTELKPPEGKATPIVEDKDEESSDEDVVMKSVKNYRSYKAFEKEHFFYLITEKGMSVRAAALQLQINPSTAQNWAKKDREDPQDIIARKKGSGRPERPPKFNEEHQRFLVSLIDKNASIVLDEMMDSLTAQFADFFKEAHFHSVERNSPEKIEERYQWVKLYMETDLDYKSNCIFIDESAFHINLKRNFAWSRKGTRAIVKVPKTRAKTTTILGAISPYGVVNIQVRRPKAPASSKRRKIDGTTGKATVANSKGGTVTGHYFNFIAKTIDILDKHPQFKGHYLVMDNAPIHTNVDIRRYVESRGYGCVYLPPYSPELNPIEQFWSVVKSKLKRVKLLVDEDLTARIGDATNQVLYSVLEGFARYSDNKFAVCLNRETL